MAATSGKVMSFDAKAYYNSGTYASPTWVLIGNMGEVSATDEMDFVDVPLRQNGGFAAGVPGFQKLSFGFKMLFNLADTVQAALRTKYRARTATEFLFLDQAVATTGATGPRGTYYMTKFSRLEEDNKPLMIDVALQPAADAAQMPEYYTAS